MTDNDYYFCSFLGILSIVYLWLSKAPTFAEATGILLLSLAFISCYEFWSFMTEDMY